MKKLLAMMLTALTMAACTSDDKYSLDFFTQQYGNNGTTEDIEDADTLAIAIGYSGSTATVTGAADQVAVSMSGAHVTVTSTTDKYLLLTLSGNSTNGSLLVYSQKKFGVVLSGLQLTNPTGPAINNQCGKALYVTLADATTNTLADGASYAVQAFDQKATLFSEGQIYFQGNGTLTVNGAAKNGIASDDYMVFDGGHISVNVAATGSNGVKVNDGLTINGGTLTIDVKADGARGIKSDARTTIQGGQTTITTSGGCKIETVDGVSDTTTCAGIKSDSLLVMTAGTLVVSSTGDGGKGINCSENVEVSGGTLTVTTTGSNNEGKPKGVKSLTGIIVSGGSFSVNVSKSWACDNGSESDEPADRITIEGKPATQTLSKKQVVIRF